MSRAPVCPQRVRVFIDFWNFQVSANQAVGDSYKPDWIALTQWLGTDLIRTVGVCDDLPVLYEGTNVYVSTSPGPRDAALRGWATDWLAKAPGIRVTHKERVRRDFPGCPECHHVPERCGECGADLILTEEKGIDVAIATDMIRLAWEEDFEWAVLVSSDRDFIPAVEFLGDKGRKVVHAGFPPHGSQLAAACWASVDLKPHLKRFER